MNYSIGDNVHILIHKYDNIMTVLIDIWKVLKFLFYISMYKIKQVFSALLNRIYLCNTTSEVIHHNSRRKVIKCCVIRCIPRKRFS